jgi:hypothetical protein
VEALGSEVEAVQQETAFEEAYLLLPLGTNLSQVQAFDLEEVPVEGRDDYWMLLQCSRDSISELEGLTEEAEVVVLVQRFELAKQKQFHSPFPRLAFARCMT